MATRQEIHENYLRLMNDDERDEGVDPVEFARKCINEGYEQVSAKYRMLARLPPGMNGIEAMIMADPNFLERTFQQWESRAAYEFRHSPYAGKHGCLIELTLQQYKEFKKLEREGRGY